MGQHLIRQAFESRLETWAAGLIPTLPIAWENVAFIAPEGRYARAFLLPADTETLFFDGTGRDYRGLFQVNFVMTIGAGAAGAEALLASLDAYFTVSMTQGGLRIWLMSPFRASSPLREDGRWVVPASAVYAALSTGV